MATVTAFASSDSPELRKARGAFFTPQGLCDYVTKWAIREASDVVLEPSCGHADFLLSAGRRLASLGPARSAIEPPLHGVELHEHSASRATEFLAANGYPARIVTSDFFKVDPTPIYDAVVGNPPYIRYQGFTGASRRLSQEAALRAGVPLTNLASSWAAFTVHAALFLKPGGRLGLVLPAELLTVNYAAEVRRFLISRFRKIRLVMFTERVFPDVSAEVVLLMAEGFNDGPAALCEMYQARNIADLDRAVARPWQPDSDGGRWSGGLLSAQGLEAYLGSSTSNDFGVLEDWGDVTLGMVTGNNKYFTLSPTRVAQLGLSSDDIMPLSPPGSRHLRGLVYTKAFHESLSVDDLATWLFRPGSEPSAAAWEYIRHGENLKVHTAYKCRVRSPWWRVPLVPRPDLFVTYMNADTPRLCTNRARVHNLNSVHGLYLKPSHLRAGQELLSIASLNSVTLVGAETVGRPYGGGILKLEPKEADRLPIPALEVVQKSKEKLAAIRPQVAARLRTPGGLQEAVRLVDNALLVDTLGMTRSRVRTLRETYAQLSQRRIARGRPARVAD
ncbi:N-6 DNA methylase [Paractinoplanes globisporus]|uniref:N-6 DNA methylase n=1 Tax=Paractinoplanes globisporus TaxID=113565 RepID=A0ABW6WVW2_9ACTN|nr:N-6 DNA methylase [Actinoplanes globisporus]